ncbi:peptidylprolyl isomerase [Chlorogloeopsis sp. ULAP01]|uniref:peptidylprolyl isomerase n=1 Tax=Chlorogloeopsis sp. ULAP01 TaxID=3056483 RepID=UPI0025AB5AFE|nr:peptidylprolyl isomerase [Chlorogloeopsis sp. ULAP01]MDM9383685.1 peptidylprolyl isomerase [Chlorogloeopsis sp. ULAP01]
MTYMHYTVDFSGISVEANEIIQFIKQNFQIKEICQKILYQKIIEKTAHEKGLTVTKAEIQAEENRLCREMRLSNQSDICVWLVNQIMDLEDWESGIRNRLLAKKLANYLFALGVEMFFNLNASDFDQVLIYKIVVPSVEIAKEILARIDANQVSFYEAAHLYDIDEKRRHQFGYEGKIYRWNIESTIATAIFNGTPGQIFGPLAVKEGHSLWMVEEIIPAELNAQSYQDVLNHIFQQWLAMELNYLLHTDNQ